MKRLLMVLVVCMVFVLVGCSGGSGQGANEQESTSQDAASQDAAASSDSAQANEESSAADDRPDKNGFDEATNTELTIAGIKVPIPSYFNGPEYNDTKTTAQYEAETGEAAVQLMLGVTTIDQKAVDSFEQSKDEYIETLLSNSNVEADDIVAQEDFELCGMSARKVDIQKTNRGAAVEAVYVVFCNTDTSELGLMVLMQTANSEFDYRSDFDKMIKGAKVAEDDASAQSEQPADAGSQATQPAQGDGKIDADKFNAITQGMTYEEVVAIIGSEGELVTTSNVAGIETSDYKWESDGWGIATIMFQNGTVVNKTQVGVGGSEGKATLEAFNRIENGMTYAQVVEIFGGEGSLVSETELMGMKVSIYSWNGSSAFSSCTVSFQNDAVNSKSQIGLE